MLWAQISLILFFFTDYLWGIFVRYPQDENKNKSLPLFMLFNGIGQLIKILIFAIAGSFDQLISIQSCLEIQWTVLILQSVLQIIVALGIIFDPSQNDNKNFLGGLIFVIINPILYVCSGGIDLIINWP